MGFQLSYYLNYQGNDWVFSLQFILIQFQLRDYLKFTFPYWIWRLCMKNQTWISKNHYQIAPIDGNWMEDWKCKSAIVPSIWLLPSFALSPHFFNDGARSAMNSLAFNSSHSMQVNWPWSVYCLQILNQIMSALLYFQKKCRQILSVTFISLFSAFTLIASQAWNPIYIGTTLRLPQIQVDPTEKQQLGGRARTVLTLSLIKNGKQHSDRENEGSNRPW